MATFSSSGGMYSNLRKDNADTTLPRQRNTWVKQPGGPWRPPGFATMDDAHAATVGRPAAGWAGALPARTARERAAPA